MSRLKTVADYERAIAELDALISRERAVEAEANWDFATASMVRSLQKEREALNSELHAIHDDDHVAFEIDVILDGRPVREHRIETEFMGKLLLRLQGLVRSMLAASSPETRETGQVKAKFRRAAELQFAGSFSGSFGMRLESIQEQVELDGSLAIAPVLRSLLELLEAGDNTDLALEKISELDIRSSKAYEDLVSELSNNEADIRVIWPNLSGPREAALRSTQASRLLTTLREVRDESNGAWYLGTLDEASKRYGRFGFMTDEGATFDGVVEEPLIDTLRDYYDRRCRAWIETRVITHQQTGVVKKSHRLQQLEPVDER